MQLHRNSRLSFEWAWRLLKSISSNDELYLATCRDCRTIYVQDAYALDHHQCPSCEIGRQGQAVGPQDQASDKSPGN
jgi:hypothetical protein